MKVMSRDKGFNKFLFQNIGRAILYFGIIVGIYFLFDRYLGDQWKEFIKPYTSNTVLMYSIYFASETFFGIIPPEFFVIWAKNNPLPVYLAHIALLATLSFIGGAIIAYSAGKLISKSKAFTKFAKRFFIKYTKVYHKWGWVVIVLSALTPVPYGTISLLSGIFNFPAKRFFSFAALRFLRFALYAWFFWEV